jgi:hypothetical protein
MGEMDRCTMPRQDGFLQPMPMAVTARVGFGARSEDGEVESTYPQEVYRQAWASFWNRSKYPDVEAPMMIISGGMKVAVHI